MADNTLNITRGASQGDNAAARGQFTREVEEHQRVGRSVLIQGRGAKFFSYDRDQGAVTASLRGSSDKADRMSDEDVRYYFGMIRKVYAVDRQLEGFLFDFDHQLFLCYALNGGSQHTPTERVKFYVGAAIDGKYHNEFEFRVVHQILGVHFRRFFRSLANEVVRACKTVIYRCDFDDPDMVEQRQQLLMLAQARDIPRHPHLVADCADAATDISSNELHAILKSKQAVIGATTNAVDKRQNVFPVRSADNFDSSVGESVPVNNDIHVGNGRYRT